MTPEAWLLAIAAFGGFLMVISSAIGALVRDGDALAVPGAVIGMACTAIGVIAFGVRLLYHLVVQ